MAGSDKVELSRSGQLWWAWSLMFVGLGMALMPWMLLASAQDDHDDAVAQQAWLTGDCVIASSGFFEATRSDGDKEQRLAVTFSLVANGQTYEGLTYTSPGYSNASLAQYPQGAHQVCYYDGKDPSRATLFRRSAPTDSRPSVGVLQVFFCALGVALFAFGVHMLLSKRRFYFGAIPDRWGD